MHIVCQALKKPFQQIAKSSGIRRISELSFAEFRGAHDRRKLSDPLIFFFVLTISYAYFHKAHRRQTAS